MGSARLLRSDRVANSLPESDIVANIIVYGMLAFMLINIVYGYLSYLSMSDTCSDLRYSLPPGSICFDAKETKCWDKKRPSCLHCVFESAVVDEITMEKQCTTNVGSADVLVDAAVGCQLVLHGTDKPTGIKVPLDIVVLPEGAAEPIVSYATDNGRWVKNVDEDVLHQIAADCYFTVQIKAPSENHVVGIACENWEGGPGGFCRPEFSNAVYSQVVKYKPSETKEGIIKPRLILTVSTA